MNRPNLADLNTDYDGQSIALRRAGHGVVRLILNRPTVRNAFNGEMVAELNHVIAELAACKDEKKLRVLVLEGAGSHFCAGADLGYMKNQASAGEVASLQDARVLATLFYRLASFPTTVIAAVRGGAIGGGFGLVCCSDVVVCEKNSVFATSEVRLGIVPGVISPYIIRKLGTGRAAAFMLSGERMTAETALRLGLVNDVIAAEHAHEFQERVCAVVNEHLKAGPNAARRTKELLRKIHPLPDPGLFEFTATSIAMARCSSEGQHGLARFFDKQSPEWCAELSVADFGVSP